ncbi:MAG: hypothetical protein M1827_006941 [Pycnora praestabilis]|nr:MAG: hypothetical protein M1827_006941 [Pycnora praestabilis]
MGAVLISGTRASPNIFPTPTLAGLRYAQVEFEVLPTSNPWTPSEIFKRLSGDPAICGWVDGNGNNTVSCNSGYTCAATSTYVGCCSTGAVGCQDLFTTCYDTQPCDAACSANSAALICEGQAPYCATYQYASGSKGYGCAAMTGYNHTVLTTTTSGGATPFGGSSATTTSSVISSSTSISTTPTSTPSMAPMNVTSISGGAIAGIAIGGAVAASAVIALVWFIMRRRRVKKRQAAQANRTSNAPSYPGQEQYVYAQYPKTEPAWNSPPLSPPAFSRHHSDQFNFGTPPASDHGGQPYSPESLRGAGSPRMSPTMPYTGPTMSELGQSVPAELATAEHEQNRPPQEP